MFESGRKKVGARRGAQRPVDVGFAPTEAKRRYEPVRVRQDSFNIERGYPNGYPLSILRRARDGTRTRDPDLGKVVLHQLSHSRIINKIFIFKAGDGNRTHVSSLEGWCSTIELHLRAQNRNRTSDTRIFSPLLYRLSYLGLPSLVCTSDAINNTL